MARKESSEDPTGETEAAALLTAGIEVIQLRCDLYFRKLGTGARDSQIFDRQISLLSSAISAGLGLGDTPDADTLASVPILGGVLTGSNANLSDAYFFSPDVKSVQALAGKAIGVVRDQYLGTSSGSLTYHSAMRGIRQAQDVCTIHSIRSLVTKAVAAGEVVPRYTEAGGRVSSPADTARRETAAALSQALGGVLISQPDVVLAYWYIQGVEADRTATFCSRLPERAAAVLCTEGKPKELSALEDGVADQLRKALSAYEAAAPGALVGELTALRAKLAEKSFGIADASIPAASADPTAGPPSFELDVR